mgnify:CR=1 FL=1
MGVRNGEVCPYCGEDMISGRGGEAVSCGNCGSEFEIDDEGFDFGDFGGSDGGDGDGWGFDL